MNVNRDQIVCGSVLGGLCLIQDNCFQVARRKNKVNEQRNRYSTDLIGCYVGKDKTLIYIAMSW